MDATNTNRDVTMLNSSRQRETGKLVRILATIKEYTCQSTLHGIQYIFHGDTKLKRFIWLVILLTSMACFTRNLWHLYSRFRTIPIATKNNIVSVNRMLFPAVTICNFNLVLKSHLRTLQKTFKGNWSNANYADILKTYGHTINEEGMLLQCTWKGKSCNSTDFFSTVEDIGLCHTFNSGRNFPLKYVTSPGIRGGLQLTLNVQVYEYNISTLDIGLKVRVHDQKEPALMKNLGFAVMPGSKALVSITKKTIVALPTRHKNGCKKIDDKHAYSKAGCLDACMDNFFTKTCHCHKLSAAIENRSNICSWTKYESCHKQSEELFDEVGIDRCKCVEACSRTSFLTELSYLMSSDVRKTNSLFEAFQRNKAGIHGINEEVKWEKFLNANVLHISIFFKEMNYQENEDVLAYPLGSFIAEAGGAMGFFLGASVLTIVELLDLICQIFVVFCRKTTRIS